MLCPAVLLSKQQLAAFSGKRILILFLTLIDFYTTIIYNRNTHCSGSFSYSLAGLASVSRRLQQGNPA
jgi:hypothetical protein